MNIPEPANSSRPATVRRWLAPAVMVVLMAVGIWTWPSPLSFARRACLHRETLRNFTAGHLLQALLLFVGAYAAAVSLSFPGATILTVAGGLLFGWFLGGCAAMIAATLGATTVFLIARSSFGEALPARPDHRFQKLREGFAADAFNYLLFLRLVPRFPSGWSTSPRP